MGGGMSKYGVRYGSKAYKAIKAGKSASKTHFEEFGSGHAAMEKSTKWFKDPSNSNSEEWTKNLKADEYKAIHDYTGESGISYHQINEQLYTRDWKNIDSDVKDRINSIDNAMNNSVLLNGMNVTRQCDFKIFGASSGKQMTIDEVKEFLKTNSKNNVLTNKGYLSSGANNHGADIDGSGLVIHIKIPPSKGAGAYVNPISKMSGSSENEFLLNRGGMYKFDPGSMYTDWKGHIHINAVWVGLDRKKKK